MCSHDRNATIVQYIYHLELQKSYSNGHVTHRSRSRSLGRMTKPFSCAGDRASAAPILPPLY